VLVLPLPGNEGLAAELARELGAARAALETRRFPDGETYLRLRSDVVGEEVVIVCTLARPDDQFLSLYSP
jgi:ribose-phosphate pyrophosphokinase